MKEAHLPPKLVMRPTRKSRIDKIKRENFTVTPYGKGFYSLWLEIDHQSFQIGELGCHEGKKHVDWMIKQAATALNRFKFGD